MAEDAGVAATSPIACVFFDLDDCLYNNDRKTAQRLTEKFDSYAMSVLSLPKGRAYELYKQYGTALRGLVEERLIEESRVDEFLAEVHDIPLDDIRPDPRLRELLLKVAHPCWIFTASTREHATRVLRRLGVEDLFRGVIAASSRDMIERVGFVTKHDPRCFVAAMEMAGVSVEKASACILLDDSVKNVKTARGMGWRTVLVGFHGRDSATRIECAEADVVVGTIHDIPRAFPELFARKACVAS